MARVYAIAAMSENRVIGNQGKIPWHLPLDFKWFKYKTMGANLVMGRKTYESIGKPLPGRKTWVLSRTLKSTEDYQVISSSDELSEKVPQGDEVFWICGGAIVYNEWLHECPYLYLTRLKKTVKGDALFPRFEHFFKLDQVIHTEAEFNVERWRNESTPALFTLPEESWPFPK